MRPLLQDGLRPESGKICQQANRTAKVIPFTTKIAPGKRIIQLGNSDFPTFARSSFV
jgi:hypothetical protein